MEKAKAYNSEFYLQQVTGINSAKKVLSMLFDIYRPQSVIDFGCGIGAWLTAAESLGSHQLTGLDGNWVDKEKLLSKNIDFIEVNFEQEISTNKVYDLCISLEVAEHIPEPQAKTFVNSLCKASNLVLFSAATKYQGGTNHINEQWQSYWVELFNTNNFQCFDIIRPEIWENEEIALCYRQNTFVFINKNHSKSLIDKLHNIESSQRQITNTIHHGYFENKIKYYDNLFKNPSLQDIIAIIKNYILNKINKHPPKS